MGRIFGYARVSHQDQNLDRQIEELKKFNPDKIYEDKASGKDFNRENYQLMKEHALLSGDTLIIKELDRLGRNKQLIKEELEDLRKKGIRVVILNIPTTKMLLSEELSGQSLILEMINNILIEVLSTIAEEERIKIRKRQAEGIALAKERGVKLGRPQRLKRGDRLKEILRQVNNKEKTVVLATKELNISRTHFYRIKSEFKEDIIKGT